MILAARYIVPVDGPVIEDGAVTIERGRIISVGPAGEAAAPDADFGQSVICPGFINAHTHLELTDLAGRVEPGDSFVDWLYGLVSLRRQSPPSEAQVRAAVREGVSQSLAAGVTRVGDITTSATLTRKVLVRSRLSGVSFGEVIAIGLLRGELSQRLDRALAGPNETSSWRWGVSPHAPYTVEPEAMRACATCAAERGRPLSIHLAESPDEAAFTGSRGGAFPAYLRKLGVWDDGIVSAGCSPVELAAGAGLLTDRTVIAHGNYVSVDDVAILVRSGASVAYCPRTHAAFGHAPHPFRAMLAAGVNVCVGTDSLASNPSLSVLDELRFLRRHHPDVPPEMLLAMGTLRGAAALGLADECGSLTPGKAADLVVLPLGRAEAWDAMLERECSPVAVYVAGEPLAQDP